MKIIFLDFDGVILTLRTSIAGGRGFTRSTPDFTVMTALHRACLAGAKLVISSAHRDLGQEHCVQILDAFQPVIKLSQYLHQVWRTVSDFDPPMGSHPASRPKQIDEWLSRHPDTTDYRILDDDAFPWTPEQQKKWLRCDSHAGMGWQSLEYLLEWSGAEKPHRNEPTPTFRGADFKS